MSELDRTATHRGMAAGFVLGMILLGVSACGNGGGVDGGASGPIAIDGSSTVYPFAQAASEVFQGQNKGVRVTVGESGTGGGFEKFCKGETDISNASRPIADDETALCKKNGITPAEIQIANDGIAIATNKALKIACLTTDQLGQLWQTNSTIKNYNELDPSFPNTEASLYGPGTDSGTFDFFTETINGEGGDTRTDYQPSEDDNVLVEGVSGDKGGLGYFGFSYFEANQDKLNLVSVDGGDGCVAPSNETIQDGSYKPLSRPLFMYVSAQSIAKPQVRALMDFVLADQAAIAEYSQIVAMTDKQIEKAQDALAKAES